MSYGWFNFTLIAPSESSYGDVKVHPALTSIGGSVIMRYKRERDDPRTRPRALLSCRKTQGISL